MQDEIKTNHPTLDGFDVHYRMSLKPSLKSYETERKTRLFIGLIIAAILTPPAIYMAWFFGFAANDPDGRAVNIAWMLPMCGYMAVMFGLRRRAKEKVMEFVTDYLGWHHVPNAKKEANNIARKLAEFGFFPKFKSVIGSDVLYGAHEDTAFAFCEIKLMDLEGWGRNRRAVTVFQGCVLSFELAAKTPATTMIARNPSKGYHRLDVVGQYDDDIGTVTVRSDDKDALDTVLCQRFKSALTELDHSFPDIDIACLVTENWLHIPLTSADRFELDWLLTAMDDPSRVQNIVSEFEDILRLLNIVLARRYCPTSQTNELPNFAKRKNIAV